MAAVAVFRNGLPAQQAGAPSFADTQDPFGRI
jgi:hypothetical protein